MDEDRHSQEASLNSSKAEVMELAAQNNFSEEEMQSYLDAGFNAKVVPNYVDERAALTMSKSYPKPRYDIPKDVSVNVDTFTFVSRNQELVADGSGAGMTLHTSVVEQTLKSGEKVGRTDNEVTIAIIDRNFDMPSRDDLDYFGIHGIVLKSKPVHADSSKAEQLYSVALKSADGADTFRRMVQAADQKYDPAQFPEKLEYWIDLIKKVAEIANEESPQG